MGAGDEAADGSTMDDVARAAGVARVTVSRAINHPDKVSPATREAVRLAIEQLGYVPDLTAGSLASRRSRIVGAIVPSLANTWFAETMDGLTEQLVAHGYQLLLGQTRYDPTAETSLVDAFIGRRVDALVLTGIDQPARLRRRLQRMHLPTVQTWDLTDDPIDMLVGFSNQRAGQAVADYLHDRGRRVIGFIGADEPRAHMRRTGLTERARALGCTVVEAGLITPPSSVELGAASLAQLMSQRPDVDAVFCSNDILAVGALFECRRRGWHVPDRLALVGFSDLPIAAACVPALTTVRVSSRDIGVHAGERLIQRLLFPEADPLPAIEDIGFRIVTREST